METTMSNVFFIPSINYMGSGCLKDAIKHIKESGYKKALIVTDAILNKIGLVSKVEQLLVAAGLEIIVFDETKPNPTIENVDKGLSLLKTSGCDCVISLGGGSPHDCAKGIALLATNGGQIADYEGVDKSRVPQLPLFAINTTAGTASEMTRFCIITDEFRHIKMAIVDKNVTPLVSVNDPELMLEKPAALTAATGMDALTHAIEAYVSTSATPVTDSVALHAIELIENNLRRAVHDGSDLTARDNMAMAQFMAGMAFNNASLGYVHAIAHQLGGYYDLPHGVCNAVLLPHVQNFNSKMAAPRLADVAKAMGVDTEVYPDVEQSAQAAIQAIRQLASDINIPTGLNQLGVKFEDLDILAENALKDACSFTNPRPATHGQVVDILTSAM